MEQAEGGKVSEKEELHDVINKQKYKAEAVLSDVQSSAQSPEALAAEPQKPDPSQALEQAW